MICKIHFYNLFFFLLDSIFFIAQKVSFVCSFHVHFLLSVIEIIGLDAVRRAYPQQNRYQRKNTENLLLSEIRYYLKPNLLKKNKIYMTRSLYDLS